MNRKLREAWLTKIDATDYETHMATIGQAQANAEHLKEFFDRANLPPKSRVLFSGAGGGQWLEYVSPDFLWALSVTFSDINADYLRLLARRLEKFRKLTAHFQVDDVESSKLPGNYDAVIAVLVLEHVDWRKAVGTMCRLCSDRILTVIQENPPALASAVTPSRPVAGTMSVFKEVHPFLLSKTKLAAEFAARGFVQTFQAEKSVLDEKKMLALEFRRGPLE